MNITFFPNGNTMCFDEKDEQVPEGQYPWIVLFFEYLESKGINPLEHTYRLPNGRIATPFDISEFRDDCKYNWSVD